MTPALKSQPTFIDNCTVSEIEMKLESHLQHVAAPLPPPGGEAAGAELRVAQILGGAGQGDAQVLQHLVLHGGGRGLVARGVHRDRAGDGQRTDRSGP